MDKAQFMSSTYQRPYLYLLRLSQKENLDNVVYSAPSGNERQCLRTLLEYCGVADPSWSELRHFASFLDCQLQDCEKSVFCNEALMGPDSGLSGFKEFAVRFMTRMSRDFATPSLEACSESDAEGALPDVFAQHQLRRRWEQMPHPYLFFNADGASMSFVNFKITRGGSVLSTRTKECLERNLMSRNLVQGLKHQGVDLGQTFDGLSRHQKLTFLSQVMGLGEITDPDPSYQLTVDNVVKLLAIHMRFRCHIPVVIMGETGCGKTRMVEFLSKLKRTGCVHFQRNGVKNMVTVKVHGGVDVQQIQLQMREAVRLAEANKQKYGVETVLFLDEANTTEAIYAIKEFVCDRTIHGEAVDATSLRVICACNPYKKHSEEFVRKLESSGLGFRVRSDQTQDKFADTPMRCLVYRVVALPPSMQPLVWDFGQLQSDSERAYIEQLVNRVSDDKMLLTPKNKQVIADVLVESQRFMREKRDECRYVSLRDVERCLVSLQWFHDNHYWLFPFIDSKQPPQSPTDKRHSEQIVWRCLIQAVGVCYHVTLEAREEYRERVSDCFLKHKVKITAEEIYTAIVSCQSAFLESVSLSNDIAHNEALRENVFMMIVCIEMRVPLFLIGKPGSSKSLAKTVVGDAMQGQNSSYSLFRKLKEAQVLSFQCSPVSDAVGIEGIFNQCAALQEKHADDQNFVAVVVLDEVGLAEDSPKMPLKVLHPLLESGTTKETNTADNVAGKVGFVGISNWALDPAKMNRGVFVHRGIPSAEELKKTAKGIFAHHASGSCFENVADVVDRLTDSYTDICAAQKREFFGLRDYYSLLKMVFASLSAHNGSLSSSDVAQALVRNFSGGEQDCLPVFLKSLRGLYPDLEDKVNGLSLIELIKDNLNLECTVESRYLLLMSTNFSAINLLSLVLDCSGFQIIFGSSFPRDDSYAKVCKDINQIKRCMEEGGTVVMLNLRDLYESLYDALNQHYVEFAKQRYVDLGLGGHRVKCRVSRSFRLIVVENMKVVYDQFPVPLINRLEKHIFTTSRILDDHQMALSHQLNRWAASFSRVKTRPHATAPAYAEKDVFVGYSDDTAAAATLAEDSFEQAQLRLLSSASSDSLFRLHLSAISEEAEQWQRVYFTEQEHDDLFSLLKSFLSTVVTGPVVSDIFSFSQMLSESDRQELEHHLGLERDTITLLNLQQFQTADEYRAKAQSILNAAPGCHSCQHILLIQCPQASAATSLTSCAKYEMYNVLRRQQRVRENSARIAVYFLHALDRDTKFHHQHTEFCSPDSRAVFVDNFRIFSERLAPPSRLLHATVSDLFEEGYHAFAPAQNSGRKQSSRMNFEPLLRSCLPTALVKLTSPTDAPETWRAKHIFGLFFENNASSTRFVTVVGQHVVGIMKQRERECFSLQSWITNVACSRDELHEAGSFSKALWLHLTRLASTAVAYVLSETDDDRNLSLLWKENADVHLKKIWLDLFESPQLCTFRWRDISKHPAQFAVRHEGGFNSKFPFSRKIVQHFDTVWGALQNADVTQRDVLFHRNVRSLRFSDILQQATAICSDRVLDDFAHDLAHCKIGQRTGNRLTAELVAASAVEVLKATQATRCADEDASNCLSDLYAIVETNRVAIQQMTALLSVVPDILNTENLTSFLQQQKGHVSFKVHLALFGAAIEHITCEYKACAESSKSPDLQGVISRLKPVAWEITQHPQSSEQKSWKALEFSALFYDYLVPSDLADTGRSQLLSILAPVLNRFWKGALSKNLNSRFFVKLVVRALTDCSRDFVLKHLVNWQNLNCKVCKKKQVVDPVVLPCSDFMCKRCVEMQADSRECPLCRKEVPKTFDLSPASLTEAQSKEIEPFVRSCASFFLAFLTTFCFPSHDRFSNGAVVDPEVVSLLGELVFTEKTVTSSKIPQFVWGVRSFILQLLLRNSEETVESNLLTRLAERETTPSATKRELMMIYICCVEDSLRPVTKLPESILEILEKQEASMQCPSNLNPVQQLKFVARLRAAIHAFCDCTCSDGGVISETASNSRVFTRLFALLSKVENAREYFVKCCCRRFGLGWFAEALRSDLLRRMIPVRLVEAGKDVSPTENCDATAASGPVYSPALNELRKLQYPDGVDDVLEYLRQKANDSADSCVQVFLALLSHCSSVDQELGAELYRDFIQSFLKNIQASGRAEHLTMLVFQPLVDNYFVGEGDFFQNTLLRDLVAAACLTVSSSEHPIIWHLNHLMLYPDQLAEKFLPTMPQSNFFDVKEVVDQWVDQSFSLPPKAYQCPNGHLYFIGNCTKPIQGNEVCPECHEPIGGMSYGELNPGNRLGDVSEDSQAGYKLQDMSRFANVVPERDCSRVAVCVIRFLLHSVMFFASFSRDLFW